VIVDSKGFTAIGNASAIPLNRNSTAANIGPIKGTNANIVFHLLFKLVFIVPAIQYKCDPCDVQ